LALGDLLHCSDLLAPVLLWIGEELLGRGPGSPSP
jgi:hypothetical protein